MPAAKELFDAGNLREAIEELTREVKAKPTDVSRRTFLFELLSFAGEYERAEKQLDVIGAQSATAEIGVQVYRNNIKAERARRRLFSDGLRPHFLTDPPAYVRLYLDAINLIRGGQFAEARELLDRADEERPAFNGKFNGESFSNFRDADELVGPVLELIVQDNYTWLPFEQIQKIEVRPPAQLRDLIWIMARIESESITGEAFIPVLYSGSSEHADDRVKLGRMTDWRQLSDDLATAVGLRLLMVDGEDRALLDARTIEFGK
jgi:type VI secretion system protein ImpE